MRYIRAIILPILIVSTIFSINCFRDPGDIDTGEHKAQTEPYYCLTNLSYCYNHHKDVDIINKYKDILWDDYYFYFDPKDVGKKVGEEGDEYIIPTSWNYEEDWQATQNMFENTNSIKLEFPNTSKDNFYSSGDYNDDNTIFTIEDVEINLLVMVAPNFGYLAKGPCNFKFELKDDGYWHMIIWEDRTAPET
ncbi:MAG: hypothetical protein DRH51_05910 [Candidatus Coatesbacteria bacterium]|nr:MAG: hypothetical protein DRH51_05910 [Candidatus Coatesbacteria bacterium]